MRARPQLWFLWLLPLLTAEVALSGCVLAFPLTHMSREIRGQIVDADTGEPIAGAAVVATWELYLSVGPFSERNQRLHIFEAVTDTAGFYFIPGWGPKPLPPSAEVSPAAPGLSIFKSGYRPHYVDSNSIGLSEAAQESDWNGKSIKLERVTDDLKGQAALLSRLYYNLSPGPASEDPKD